MLKNVRYWRICPDCKVLILYFSHFKAYMHGISVDCAYMENEAGERIFDNSMREDAVKKYWEARKIRDAQDGFIDLPYEKE